MRRLTAGLLGPRDPAQPLLTLLVPEGRVELSGATTANWVAKTANLLRSSGSPTRVGICLPLHWQAVTLLLGGLAAGATVVVGPDVGALPGCDVLFVTAGDAEAALDVCEGDVYAVSTAPLGGRLRDLPPLVLDAGVELPGYGDVLAVPAPAGWRVEQAGSAVTPPDLGLTGADRVLTVLPPYGDGLTAGVLAPLAAGSALVLAPYGVDGLDVAAERVTATVGCGLPGVRQVG